MPLLKKFKQAIKLPWYKKVIYSFVILLGMILFLEVAARIVFFAAECECQSDSTTVAPADGTDLASRIGSGVKVSHGGVKVFDELVRIGTGTIHEGHAFFTCGADLPAIHIRCKRDVALGCERVGSLFDSLHKPGPFVNQDDGAMRPRRFGHGQVAKRLVVARVVGDIRALQWSSVASNRGW